MKPNSNQPFSSQPKHDIFLSFTTKDRVFVKKLYDTLHSEYGITPWYSGKKFYDHIPDFVLYDINEAIKNSTYCIAVFSKNIIANKWFFAEVGGFYHRESLQKRIIIPVLHNISHEEFILNFPIFADRFVIFDTIGVDHVAREISKFICDEKPDIENTITKQFRHYFKVLQSFGSKSRKEKIVKIDDSTLEIIDTQSIKKNGIDQMEGSSSVSKDWLNIASDTELRVYQKLLRLFQKPLK